MALSPPVILVSGLLVGTHGTYIAAETAERRQKFAQASTAAARSGKPLLVVGRPKGRHTCGAVVIDIDPRVLQDCPAEGRIADVRNLPFASGVFGAAIASHVLEHLPVADIPRAWCELNRVADTVFVAGPKPNLLQWFALEHTCVCYQLADGSIEVRGKLWPDLLFRLDAPAE